MIVSLLLWGGLAYALTGCAGVELGGKLGVYRVDERADSSATKISQTKPLKCWFVSCPDYDFTTKAS